MKTTRRVLTVAVDFAGARHERAVERTVWHTQENLGGLTDLLRADADALYPAGFREVEVRDFTTAEG